MPGFARFCDGITEEPRCCEGARGPLHTVVYYPRSGRTGSSVVLAPPDGEERDWAVRTLVTAARVMAKRGFTVARFDYYGQGESEGNYDEATIDTRVADLLAVSKSVSDQTGSVPVIVAARLSAAVALAAASQERSIRQLALWEPVLDSEQYLQQLLRVNVSTQMVTHGKVIKERPELIADAQRGQAVSVNGYPLTGAFIDALLAFDALAALAGFEGRTLCLTLGVTDRRLAAFPTVEATRVQATSFWREPKLYTAAPTAFLEPTIEWLARPTPQRT